MAHDTKTSDLRASVLAALEVPEHNHLSEPQVRGAACVWCAVILSPANAVDLGKRRVRVLDDHVDTFPRGCRRCTGEAARRTLFAHAPVCENCITDAGSCAQGVHLRRLIREGGR